jgi:hypothetical protein
MSSEQDVPNDVVERATETIIHGSVIGGFTVAAEAVQHHKGEAALGAVIVIATVAYIFKRRREKRRREEEKKYHRSRSHRARAVRHFQHTDAVSHGSDI